MTIASEITRIQNNIANAYVALNDKGATMPETQNSANLATTVSSIPAGGGDVVTAVNYTGSTINQGDKVWLNKKGNVSASAVAVSANVYSNPYIIDPTGTAVYYSTNTQHGLSRYDITAQTTAYTGGEYYNFFQTGKYPRYYDAYNNIFYTKYLIDDAGSQDINIMCNQDDYAINYSTTQATTFDLYKVDKQNNFNITKTWNVSGVNNTYSYNRMYCVIGNKLYAASSYKYIGTIDENSSTITMSTRSDGYATNVIYSTADNKIAIVADTSSNNPSVWGTVQLVSINNDYTLGSLFVSANNDLNNLLNLSQKYLIFNRNTGILCISDYSNYGSGHYGIFKYENNDFTTLPIELNNTSGVSVIGAYTLSITDDLSKVQYGEILYTLQQVADGTYKAIPYTYGIGNQTLTGIANETALNGASFEATTILGE